jgi:lambda repressor-like predicted transcriptional regulator
MDQPKKWNVWKTVLTAVVVGAIAIGVMSFAPQLVQAQDSTTTSTTTSAPAGRGLPGFDRPFFGSEIDYEALLAEALGISVEELQAAEQQAYAAGLEQAVANGDLTAEEAELMKAQQALKGAIDQEALQATALGMTVEELQAARDAGTTMDALLEQQGLTPAAYRTALQDAYEAAIQQAVSDGIITQDQADLVLSSGGGRGLMPGVEPFGRGGGHGGRGGHGDFGFPGGAAPDTTAPSGGTN